MDLDSSNFDSKRYVLNMLKTSSIKDLIDKNNKVEEEIRSQDHDIQELVFQNYSKFISSIDTVRQMKNNICHVDQKLKTLDRSMEKISELALKIDGTFSVKRKQIQKLDTINKDLQKLKNLCDFPNVLKQDLAYFKSLPQAKIPIQAHQLFSTSIQSYQNCYSTLYSLRDQPLIAPIFKQSVNKVDEVRTILRSLQAQFKTGMHNKVLRQVTRKLLIVSQDQISVLRSYFLSWKQRLSKGCFKGQKTSLDQKLADLLSGQIHQLNDNLWNQFQAQLVFLALIRSKIPNVQEIQLLINNHARDVFNSVINKYADAVPQYCCSLRAFVQVNHFVVTRSRQAIRNLSQKTIQQLENKLFEKAQNLGKIMVRFIFGRLKVGLLAQLGEARKDMLQCVINEENLKIKSQKVVASIKQYLNTNYKLLLNDLEYLQNSRQTVFRGRDKFQDTIHIQIEEFLKSLSYLACHQLQYISEEIFPIINLSYSSKMHRSEKAYLENSLKQYINQSPQSASWFVTINSFLNMICNSFGKKAIENTQKRLQLQGVYDYAKVFTYIKSCGYRNLVGLANYCAYQTSKLHDFKEVLQSIEKFIACINCVFPDLRRAIIKKPSFLSQTPYALETQILTAKKLHIYDKKNCGDRAYIISVYIRKILKQNLRNIRKGIQYKQEYLYSLIQIFYQLSSVDEQSQIIAFYYLLKSNWKNEWKTEKADLQQYFANIRGSMSISD